MEGYLLIILIGPARKWDIQFPAVEHIYISFTGKIRNLKEKKEEIDNYMNSNIHRQGATAGYAHNRQVAAVKRTRKEK
jgi:hypothetical protein